MLTLLSFGNGRLYGQAALVLAVIVSLWPLFGLADTEGASPLASLRAEYTRLRNNDPETEDPQRQAEWIALATRIKAQLAEGSPVRDTHRLRLDGADVHLRLWRALRRPSFLDDARELVRPLLDQQSAAPGFFDAALLQGDIEVCAGGRREDASSWYQAALNGDEPIARRARQRLLGIELQTFEHFVPAPEIEQPRLARRLSSVTGGARKTVVLDPGHGGDDSGAVGEFDLLEKEVTLDLSVRVKEVLEGEHGVRVILTRAEDVFVPLARRTAIANKSDADVFVSLHTNASPSHRLTGLETYYLDNTDDQASRKLAERENGVASGGDLDDLSFIVSDLIQSGKLEDSIQLSRVVDGSLRARVLRLYPEGRSLGVKRAPFFVLVGAHMPCSLIELFFIDNPHDARQLADSDFRDTLARAIADGIARFLQGVSSRPSAERDVRRVTSHSNIQNQPAGDS